MMAETVNGERARVQRSRCTVTPAESEWRVHEFWVCGGGGGEALCRCAALRMRGSLLLWLGSGGAPRLGEAALGAPAGREGRGSGGVSALATPLLGAADAAATAEGAAAALARRLAAALARPVFVFCGATFDRFTAPLVERGLVAEIKKWDM